MKARIVLIAVAMAAAATAAAPVFASDFTNDLARQSGLSERKVRMVLGTRTAYAGYTSCYQRSVEKITAAIGKDSYQRLLDGETVAISRPVAVLPDQASVENTL